MGVEEEVTGGQEQHAVKWNPELAEAGSSQVHPSSLGNWLGVLGRKAEEGISHQGERVGAGDVTDFVAWV